jgi:hypothetical protein
MNNIYFIKWNWDDPIPREGNSSFTCQMCAGILAGKIYLSWCRDKAFGALKYIFDRWWVSFNVDAIYGKELIMFFWEVCF